MARHPPTITGTFDERCAALAALKLQKASVLPLGAERAQLEREAWELQNATAMNDMLLVEGGRPSI